MPPLSAVSRTAAAIVVSVFLATGCSGQDATSAKASSQPSATGTIAPVSSADRAYYGCLEDQGVVMESRDDGQLRVDKDRNKDEALVTAEKQCASLAPDPEPAAAEDLATAKKFSACMREKGIKDYPDPDPETGEIRYGAEAAHKGDPDFVSAAQACNTGSGPVGSAVEN